MPRASRKVAGLNPDEATGFFLNLIIPSVLTINLALTQLLTEMNIWNCFVE
jgi:hypothetical protein